ncbi:colicin-A [Salmonella enterica]|nr:colicin-A [Salmonella enterica]ECN5821028.1 colicin-A [Salmonella enterica subsp. enterica serovar Infantis]EDW6859288.1 colicin-A [Salmonella enterica]EEJ5734852.1 colicin-A [Salmonella enterica]EIY0670583.1 colicin immunity protein [Salmonella enterica]
MFKEQLTNTNNRKANNLLYLFMVIGIIPLFCILAVYSANPDNPFLLTIATGTENLPSITSSFNPLMTKVMDIYCKTAPFFALILYILTFKIRQLINNTDRNVVLRSCLLSPLVYAVIVYLFCFRDFELTTAGRPVRLMATNDVTLLFFYIGLYSIIFFTTYITLFTPVTAFKLFKKRQ